jgi:hypothetical protein
LRELNGRLSQKLDRSVVGAHADAHQKKVQPILGALVAVAYQRITKD